MRQNAWAILAKQHRIYWKVTPALQRLKNYQDLWIRDAADSGHSARETASRVWDLIRKTLYDFFRSTVLTAAIYCGDIFILRPYYETFVPLGSDVYSDLLLSVTGLSGVFIGLYYAAISTVGSAIYARFPISIRTLLIEERSGALYMRLLSWLGFACLLLTTIDILGGRDSFLALTVVVAFSAVAIFGFVLLGKTIFNYFDPSTLSHEVYRSIIRQINRVSHSRATSGYAHVQRSAHARAASSVLALSDLKKIVSESGHLRDSYIQLVNNMLRLLTYYTINKGSIPHTSKWYPERYAHEDWYRSSESIASIHTRTGTYLQPKSAPDTDWLEQQIEPIVRECLAETIKKDSFENIRKLLADCVGYVRHHAALGATKKSLDFSKHTLVSLGEACARTDSAVTGQQWVLIADAAAALYVETIVYTRHWHSQVAQAEVSAICALPWGSKNILHKAPRGEHYVQPICTINDQICFEISVEKKRVTQDWFIKEHIHRVLSVLCKEQVEGLEKAQIDLLDAADNLATDHAFVAAAIYSRLLEYSNKFSGYIDTFEATQTTLLEDAKINGLVWEQVDFSALTDRTTQVSNRLTAKIATHALQLGDGTRDSELPDYLGQFLDYVNGQLVRSLFDRDSDKFNSLYPATLFASLLKYEQLRPNGQIAEHLISSTFGVVTSSFLDVAEIGGIALVVADAFDHPQIRQRVESVWSSYLNHTESGEGRQRLMAAAVSSLSAPMAVLPREVIRTGWRQELGELLAQLPRRPVPQVRRPHLIVGERGRIDHPSALVRVFAQEHNLFFGSGVAAFAHEILYPYAQQLGLDLGSSVQNLKESIEREGRTDMGDAHD